MARGDLPDLERLKRVDPEAAQRLEALLRRLMGGAEAHRRAVDQLPVLLGAHSEAARLSVLVRLVGDLLPGARVGAVAWEGEGEALRLKSHAGAGDALPVAGAAPRSLLAEVARCGQAIWLASPQADPQLSEAASVHPDAARGIGVVPLGEGAALTVHPAGGLPGTFERQQVEALAGIVARLRRPQPAPPPVPAIPGLVGRSAAMEELRAAIVAFAPVSWPALVLGETGTGKEVVARALHALSPRADGPFVGINAAAIPDELAESTLFGHERGAFTGADRPRQGLVERASGGTLFLDEIGDVSPRVQTRLLRLLQEGTYERVGGTRELRFEGRIVAATLRPVDTDAPGFRTDLYYRLSACVLRVPPLRERAEDIPDLARFLFARAAAELPVKLSLSADAIDVLVSRPWPGNVRELENVLRGALAAAWAKRAESVGPEHLPGGPRPAAARAPKRPSLPPSLDLAEATEAFQKGLVEEALRAEQGNRAAAARRLGVSKQWLHRLLSRWGRDTFEPAARSVG